MTDNVSSPSHYQQGYIESIYAIHQVLGDEGFKAFCIGNYLKYKMRHAHKNGEEDLKKAEVYLGWATNGLPKPVNGKLPEPPIETAADRCQKILKGVIESKTSWKVAELTIVDHPAHFEVSVQLTLFRGLHYAKGHNVRFRKAMKYTHMADALLDDIRRNCDDVAGI